MADFDDPRSISDILKSLGYSHEKVTGDGAHKITHDATGEVIGYHHAGTAIAAAEKHAAALGDT